MEHATPHRNVVQRVEMLTVTVPQALVFVVSLQLRHVVQQSPTTALTFKTQVIHHPSRPVHLVAIASHRKVMISVNLDWILTISTSPKLLLLLVHAWIHLMSPAEVQETIMPYVEP